MSGCESPSSIPGDPEAVDLPVGAALRQNQARGPLNMSDISAPPVRDPITLSPGEAQEIQEDLTDRSPGSVAVQRCLYLIDRLNSLMSISPYAYHEEKPALDLRLEQMKKLIERESRPMETEMDNIKLHGNSFLVELNETVDRICSLGVQHIVQAFKKLHAGVGADMQSSRQAVDKITRLLDEVDVGKLKNSLKNAQPGAVGDVMRENLMAIGEKVKVANGLYKEWMADLNARREACPIERYHDEIKHAIHNSATAMQNMLNEYTGDLQMVYINSQRNLRAYIEHVLEAGAKSLMDLEAYRGYLDNSADHEIVVTAKELLVHLSKFPGMGGKPIALLPRSVDLAKELVDLQRPPLTKELDLEPSVNMEILKLDGVIRRCVAALKAKPQEQLYDVIEETCHNAMASLDESVARLQREFSVTEQGAVEQTQRAISHEMTEFSREKAQILENYGFPGYSHR